MIFSLSLFAPENLVLRDGFCSPVPRQPAHCILRLNLVLPPLRGVQYVVSGTRIRETLLVCASITSTARNEASEEIPK